VKTIRKKSAAPAPKTAIQAQPVDGTDERFVKRRRSAEARRRHPPLDRFRHQRPAYDCLGHEPAP
jgi:hypothetical protein